MSQLATKEYLWRTLGRHVTTRTITNDLNLQLADRELLATAHTTENANFETGSSDDRILARDVTGLMVMKLPTEEILSLKCKTMTAYTQNGHSQ